MGDLHGRELYSALLSVLPWVLAMAIPLALVFVVPFNFGPYLVHDLDEDRMVKRKPRVLVVDDDESSVLSLLSVLSDKTSRVQVVESAKAMLKELQRHHYDILFVDKMMPDIEGDEALTLVDQMLSFRKVVPVVFFTGAEDKFDIPALSHFSVLGVWGKRLSYLVLEDKVNRVLKSIQTGGFFGYQ